MPITKAQIPTDDERLARQVAFILEIDRAKQVLRRSRILDESRRENDAEHSWHLAVMALVLAESAKEPVDVLKVVKMLLVHDIVEIDAGDSFAYDEAAQRDKRSREERAARRIFGLLPLEQAEELQSLWEEFEARKTAEAKFAAALDRLQPILLNYFTKGSTWREHGVTRTQAIAFNRHMEEGAPALWRFARQLIDDAARSGYLVAD